MSKRTPRSADLPPGVQRHPSFLEVLLARPRDLARAARREAVQ